MGHRGRFVWYWSDRTHSPPRASSAPGQDPCCLELAFEGVDDIRQVSRAECARLGLNPKQHLLLTGRPAKVTIDVVMTRPNVLQRATAIEVLRTRQHGHPPVAVEVLYIDVVGIEVIQDGVGNEQVDTTKPIDELDQALETDPRVLVDADVEVALDGRDRGRGPTVRVRRVDLRAAAGRQWHPEVPRNGEHRHTLAGRLDADQDHRLCQHVSRLVYRLVVRSKQ